MALSSAADTRQDRFEVFNVRLQFGYFLLRNISTV
jgi:hypothetical protein